MQNVHIKIIIKININMQLIFVNIILINIIT